MSIYLLSLLLFIFLAAIPSKNTSATGTKNNIFLEAGGFGGYGSLNYERFLFGKGYLQTGIRTGIGTYKIRDFKKAFNPDVIIPLSINMILGREHCVELNLGQTWSSMVYAPDAAKEAGRENYYSANIGIGYRYQKEQNKIFFRMTYSPYVEQLRKLRNWWGVSIGYGF